MNKSDISQGSSSDVSVKSQGTNSSGLSGCPSSNITLSGASLSHSSSASSNSSPFTKPRLLIQPLTLTSSCSGSTTQEESTKVNTVCLHDSQPEPPLLQGLFVKKTNKNNSDIENSPEISFPTRSVSFEDKSPSSDSNLQLSSDFITPTLSSTFIKPKVNPSRKASLTFTSSSSSDEDLKRQKQKECDLSAKEDEGHVLVLPSDALHSPNSEEAIDHPEHEGGCECKTQSQVVESQPCLVLELSQDFSQKVTNESNEPEPITRCLPGEEISGPSRAHFNDGEIPGPSRNLHHLCNEKKWGDLHAVFPVSFWFKSGSTLDEFVDTHARSIRSIVYDYLKGKKETQLEISAQNVITVPESSQNKAIEIRHTKKLAVGCKVFARWNDGRYYPGIISKRNRQTVQVTFLDNNKAAVPRDHVCLQKIFRNGQKILALIDGGYYSEATVLHAQENASGDGQSLMVAMENSSLTLNSLEKISLTREQFKSYSQTASENVTLASDKIQNPKKRKWCEKDKTKNPIESKRYRSNSSSNKTSDGNLPLFHGYCFLLTSGSSRGKQHRLNDNTPPLGGTNNSSSTVNCNTSDVSPNSIEDEGELDKRKLTEQIKHHGGIVITKLNRRSVQKKSCQILCLTNKIARTYKFLYCVAVGIPILWDTYILDCVEKNEVLPLRGFVVPSGVDLTGERIDQAFQSKELCREVFTPLTPLRIFVHIKAHNDQTELNLLLETVGCERVCKGFSVTKNSRSLRFDMKNVDYILTLERRVPKLLLEEAKKCEKKIVTSEWLIQCVVTNQLLDEDSSPRFLYSHRE